MPFGKYPDRVKPFRKWANEKVDNSKLSDSATPSGGRGSRRSATRRNRRRRKKAMEDA